MTELEEGSMEEEQARQQITLAVLGARMDSLAVTTIEVRDLVRESGRDATDRCIQQAAFNARTEMAEAFSTKQIESLEKRFWAVVGALILAIISVGVKLWVTGTG